MVRRIPTSGAGVGAAIPATAAITAPTRTAFHAQPPSRTPPPLTLAGVQGPTAIITTSTTKAGFPTLFRGLTTRKASHALHSAAPRPALILASGAGAIPRGGPMAAENWATITVVAPSSRTTATTMGGTRIATFGRSTWAPLGRTGTVWDATTAQEPASLTATTVDAASWAPRARHPISDPVRPCKPDDT